MTGSNCQAHPSTTSFQLLEEKSQVEARLSEINAVLESETPSSRQAPAIFPAPRSRSRTQAKRGRKPAAGNRMSLREAVIEALSMGPVARNELVSAVESVGYKFDTDNPLNSIGSVLYAKKGSVKKTPEGKFFVDNGARAKTSNDKGSEAKVSTAKKKRKISPEGRARIAAAAKARWARERAGK